MTEENKDFSIEKFSPAKEQVLAMVAEAKKADLTVESSVHDARISLRDLRISITKRGKELREGAMRFQKDVIAKEKELVSFITPEEEKLEKIEEEMKLKREMEARRDELPTRIAALDAIGDGIMADENELLAMDDNEFNEYRLRRIDGHLTRKAEEMEQKKRDEAAEEAKRKAKEEAERDAKRKEEEAKLAAERAVLEKEKAAIEAEKKAAADAEAKRLREIELKEREERLAKEKAEREAAEAKQKEADMLREKKFTEWLESIGYNKDTDNVQTSGDGKIKVWRLIATYDPSK